jgi:hypothetical protein
MVPWKVQQEMTIDFKPVAVQFVRSHNCAANTPVELIQEAMLTAVIAFGLRETKLLRRLHTGNSGGDQSGQMQDVKTV